jgi:hypothetical protein
MEISDKTGYNDFLETESWPILAENLGVMHNCCIMRSCGHFLGTRPFGKGQHESLKKR